MTKRPLLEHKDVSYITERVKVAARAFLPDGSQAQLDAAAVDRFVSATADDPDTRLAVLGVLRAHAANGAEVMLSGFALLISVVGVLIAVTQTGSAGAWVLLISVAEVVALIFVVAWALRVAGAAHIREITALVWLAAYEDPLKSRVEPARFRRWRR